MHCSGQMHAHLKPRHAHLCNLVSTHAQETGQVHWDPAHIPWRVQAMKTCSLCTRLRHGLLMQQDQAAAYEAYAMTDACHKGGKALVLLLYEVPQLPNQL